MQFFVVIFNIVLVFEYFMYFSRAIVYFYFDFYSRLCAPVRFLTFSVFYNDVLIL